MEEVIETLDNKDWIYTADPITYAGFHYSLFPSLIFILMFPFPVLTIWAIAFLLRLFCLKKRMRLIVLLWYWPKSQIIWLLGKGRRPLSRNEIFKLCRYGKRP